MSDSIADAIQSLCPEGWTLASISRIDDNIWWCCLSDGRYVVGASGNTIPLAVTQARQQTFDSKSFKLLYEPERTETQRISLLDLIGHKLYLNVPLREVEALNDRRD